MDCGIDCAIEQLIRGNVNPRGDQSRSQSCGAVPFNVRDSGMAPLKGGNVTDEPERRVDVSGAQRVPLS